MGPQPPLPQWMSGMGGPNPQQAPQTAARSPEIQPALDETRPQIAPNLAANPALCQAVAQHLYRDFAYPYLMQQQRMWDTWDRIDDAFRVREKSVNLDIASTDPARRKLTPDGQGSGLTDPRDGVGAKITPAAMHKQICAKTDLHMALAWEDFPVRVMKPETLFEHPLYNPTQQTIDAANELLRQNAHEIGMKELDRIGRGCFAKNGHAWAHTDFRYATEDRDQVFPIPPDPQSQMMLMQAMAQRFPRQAPQQQVRMGQPCLVYREKEVKIMQTSYTVLRVDDVFIDQTLSVNPMESQLCPGFRSHVTRADLFENDYDPDNNPFGWLNCQMARRDNLHHYSFSAQDEQYVRLEMQKRYNMSAQGDLRPLNSRKQLWTWYPMLAIDPATGALDTGDGVDCADCQARGNVQTSDGSFTCPSCNGSGKVDLRPQRYVVQLFGNLMTGGAATVLRIQLNPTVDNLVPLLQATQIPEDNSTAIPLCKSEAALNAHVQLATSINQWYDAKNQMINRPWLVRSDSQNVGVDLNRPGRNIEVDDIRNEAMPIPTITFDITQNLQPFIQLGESEVKAIQGVNDTLLGEISAGRRAASEIQTAADASRTPIVAEVDRYNAQLIGGWARFALRNIEVFADRDWIRRKTGRDSFGRVEIFASTAQEYVKKQALIGSIRYVLEASAMDPSINRAVLWGALFKLTNMPNAEQIVNDGVRKAMSDAMHIVTEILGNAQWVPPQMSEPHAIYIEVFQQALLDEYWQKKTPETLPLLQQRIAMQQQLQMMQQIQAQQQALMIHGPAMLPGMGGPPALPAPGAGNQPPTPNAPPMNPTQMMQQNAGAQQG